MKNVRVLRKSQVIESTGINNTKLYELIAEGFFPPYLNLAGKRATGFFEHEVNTVMLARAADYSDDQIKSLVQRLVEQRKEMLDELLQDLCA